MDQSRPLFVYFRYFLDTISMIQIEKNVDGVLGIRTRCRRMVGADETTDLRRPPKQYSFNIWRTTNDAIASTADRGADDRLVSFGDALIFALVRANFLSS